MQHRMPGRHILPSILLLLVAFPAFAATSVTLAGPGGMSIYGDFYAGQKSKPLILLFHQAGSSKAEYAPIAPVLVQHGYNCLAIDQSSGDDLYGPNETVQHLGHSTGYLAVLPEMETALAWGQANGYKGRIIAWGSSYSAALVFLLAAKHPNDLMGLLSFSPGEYLGKPDLVKNAAAKVKVPVFVTSASSPEEIANARAIITVVPAVKKVQFVPLAGVHGSSTLRQDKDPDGAAQNWRATLAFLGSLK